MKSFKRILSTGLVLLLVMSAQAMAEDRLKLSTTTSTEASGLLTYLLPTFEKQNNVRVDVIPVGTGKAIELAKAGDVDVTLVHARSKEDEFVESGYGINRRDVMYNDFIILGVCRIMHFPPISSLFPEVNARNINYMAVLNF